jgi:hypothetical protein
MSKNITDLFATSRYCFFIPVEGFVEGHGYRVSIVFEGESGHYPTGDWPYESKPGQKMPWFWGEDYDAACRTADAQNDRIGISRKLALEIINSSMLVSKGEVES